LIPLRPAIVRAAVDQPFDLAFGEVFAGSDGGILGRRGVTFRFTMVAATIFRAGFGIDLSLSLA